MIKTGKIAVIGDKDSILAFKAVGAETFAAETVFDVNDTLHKLVKGDYAVVFITEKLAETAHETLSKLKDRPYPVVIPIPSGGGSTGYAMTGIKKDVERAIGADILFNKDE